MDELLAAHKPLPTHLGALLWSAVMKSADLTATACPRDDENDPAALLASFKERHSRLVAAMAVLDRITRQPLPDRPGYTSARWRLSAASISRRSLWRRCFCYLEPLVEGHTARALEDLHRQDLDLLNRSAAHVRRWPADEIERDWPLYCEASRAIRTRMGAGIDAEKRLLYPILRIRALRTAFPQPAAPARP